VKSLPLFQKHLLHTDFSTMTTEATHSFEYFRIIKYVDFVNYLKFCIVEITTFRKLDLFPPSAEKRCLKTKLDQIS
jgi:hypothetical protein